MVKRTISLLAAMSLVGIWWSDAGAAPVCVQWRTLGGSNVCSKWSTKGVLLELTFGGQNCGPDGSLCQAEAEATSTGPGNIAFCSPLVAGGPPRRTTCTDTVNFAGVATECDPKHEQDNTGTGGKGHDKGKHGCTATIVLATVPGTCQNACTVAFPGSSVLDVTPIEMNTQVIATVDGGEGGSCDPNSSTCTFEEHCAIPENKIKYNAVKPYDCSLTCSGDGCFD